MYLQDDSTGCVVDDLSDNMGEMMAISFRNLEKAANVKLPVQKTRAQKAEERRRKKEEQLKRDEMRLETEFIGKVVKKKQKEVSGHELITKNQVNSLLNLVFENKESRSSKNKERSSSVAVNFPDEPRNGGRNQEVVKDQRPTRIKSSSRRSKSLQASVPDFPAEKYNDIREDERGSNQGTQGNINEKISSEEKLDSLRDICDQEIKDEQIDESEVHFMKSVRKGHDCRTVSQSSYEEVMKEPKNEEGANDFDKEYNDNMNANSKEFDLEYDLDAVGSRNDECIKQTDEEYDNYDAVERQEWDLQETYEYTPSEPDDEEVNWESGGIEEDGDLPDLISLPNERAELDIEAFRNKFLHLKFHDEMDAKNSPCPSTCACRGLWDTNAYALTPLHLAAALANPHQKVEDWLKKRKKGGRMSAMDVAVEQGRIDNLKVFLRQPMAEVLLALDMKNPYDKYLKTEAFDCKVQHVSLLSRLIENFHLDKLDEEEKRIVITYVTEQQLIHAIDMSLTRGNVENLIILGKYHPHVSDDYLGDYLAQDEEESNVFPGRNLKKEQTPITPPAAHLLAQYGHYQTFSKLTKEHKRSLDQFKFTALSSVLEFENDEDVKKELNAFKSVGREDIFVFVSQIIVKHKKGQSP
uniref:Uncharacterized protein n=2 Tax=Caenorhabditis japonica TaxID=281687 RepID=A0A8R1HGZ1_CAEJA